MAQNGSSYHQPPGMVVIGSPGGGQTFANKSIITSTASKGGSGRTPGTIVSGRPGWGKSFGTEEAVAKETLDYHTRMLPIWISALNPADPTDYTRVPTGYLKDLYPHVYYWGPKGDILAQNLRRMNEIRAQDLINLEKQPGYTQELQKDSITEDLLLTYHDTKLGQMLLKEDVPALLPYLKALHDAQLFRIAYRNVSTAELHEESLVAVGTKDTPLHDFYASRILQYIPAVWNNDSHGYVPHNQIEVTQSVFVRICLSEPIMGQVDVVAGDWEKHVAFCERWALTP